MDVAAHRLNSQRLVGARSATTGETDLGPQLGEPTRGGLLRRDRAVSWSTGEDGVVHFLTVTPNERGVAVDLCWELPGEDAWAPADQCASEGEG